MDEDIELRLSPVRKSGPRMGRRANASQNAFSEEAPPPRSQQDGADETIKLASSAVLSKASTDEPIFSDQRAAPGSRQNHARGRRTGGWADESGKIRGAPEKGVEFSSESAAASHGGGGGEDSEEETLIIPDLDDVRDEDIQQQVADAPSVLVNRVATYKELDNDLLNHVAFATLDDIDLRVLTRCLAPEQALKEPDETWTWDVLFFQVSDELHRESLGEEHEEPVHGREVGNAQVTVAGPDDDVGYRVTRDRPYTAFNRFPV